MDKKLFFRSMEYALNKDLKTIERAVLAITQELNMEKIIDLGVIITIIGDFAKIPETELGIEENSKLYELTLGIVYKLLKEKQIVAGSMNEDWTNFFLWNLSPEEAVLKIGMTWRRYNRQIRMGEIAWFKANEEQQLKGPKN